MSSLFTVLAAFIAAAPGHPALPATDDPQLCFIITAYTNYHIPIPCGEQDQYTQEHGPQAHLLAEAGAGRLPLYFGRCTNPIPIAGCQSHRLNTTKDAADVAYYETPLGYIYDPALPRPAGTQVLVQCHETTTIVMAGLGWSESLKSDMWNYLIVDDPAQATCWYYWQDGSHSGEVVGYVNPL